jgi:hypothetical protein
MNWWDSECLGGVRIDCGIHDLFPGLMNVMVEQLVGVIGVRILNNCTL